MLAAQIGSTAWRICAENVIAVPSYAGAIRQGPDSSGRPLLIFENKKTTLFPTEKSGCMFLMQ